MKTDIRIQKSGFTLSSLAFLAAWSAFAVMVRAQEAPTFVRVIVDPNTAGDCKMVADFDGDGNLDGAVGGSTSERLNWYHFPTWQRTIIATPNVEFSTDGEAVDIDHDGDMDIVLGDGPTGVNLVWYENPLLPDGDPFVGSQWTRHAIGSSGWWVKDVEPHDYDGDGLMDVAIRTETQAVVYYQKAGLGWSRFDIEGGLTGEGMFSGDVDRDGDFDLILPKLWKENPGTRSTTWPTHIIDQSMVDEIKAVVADLDGDGHNEIVVTCSECTANAVYYTRSDPSNPYGSWTRRTIVPNLERGHTLQAGDIDLDGHMDLLIGQMHTSQAREIAMFLNQTGDALQWDRHVIDNTGMHNGVLADFGRDGDLDLFGSNWTGNEPIRFYENQTPLTPFCVADQDDGTGTGTRDGGVTIDDILYYVEIFGLGQLRADVDDGSALGRPDGGVTIDDLLYFLVRFNAGC